MLLVRLSAPSIRAVDSDDVRPDPTTVAPVVAELTIELKIRFMLCIEN